MEYNLKCQIRITKNQKCEIFSVKNIHCDDDTLICGDKGIN